MHPDILLLLIINHIFFLPVFGRARAPIFSGVAFVVVSGWLLSIHLIICYATTFLDRQVLV